jgi:methylmalonyl-CoA/ethylmalonyl-CoA epimerase
MKNITHVDHIAIATKDLKKSLEFFEQGLGLKCEHLEELPQRGLRIAMLPIGELRIELMEATRPDSEISAFLEKRGPGIHHIAFATPDASLATNMLRTQGIALTSDSVQVGARDSRVAFVHPKSSGGVLLELVEPAGNKV